MPWRTLARPSRRPARRRPGANARGSRWSGPTASASTDRGDRAVAPIPRTRRARAISVQISPKVCTRCSAAASATTGRAGSRSRWAEVVAQGVGVDVRHEHRRGQHDDQHPQAGGERSGRGRVPRAARSTRPRTAPRRTPGTIRSSDRLARPAGGGAGAGPRAGAHRATTASSDLAAPRTSRLVVQRGDSDAGGDREDGRRAAGTADRHRATSGRRGPAPAGAGRGASWSSRGPRGRRRRRRGWSGRRPTLHRAGPSTMPSDGGPGEPVLADGRPRRRSSTRGLVHDGRRPSASRRCSPPDR